MATHASHMVRSQLCRFSRGESQSLYNKSTWFMGCSGTKIEIYTIKKIFNGKEIHTGTNDKQATTPFRDITLNEAVILQLILHGIIL